MNTEGIRTEFLLRQAIDGQLDDVVKTAKDVTKLLEKSELKTSQLTNVINVATSTDSIRAITNFIRYQIGRDRAGNSWRHNNFGEEVIAKIERGAVHKAADEAAGEVAKEVGEEAQEGLFKKARLRLTRLFLGYIARCFQYSSSEEGRWDYVL